MINERLGHELRDQLMAVYVVFTHEEAFHGEKAWKQDPSFLFYMAIYEEMWRLKPGVLMGPARGEFEENFPSYRSDAQIVAAKLFMMGPNIYTQFLYFISVVCHYIKPIDHDAPQRTCPYECGAGQPTPEDWADALNPSAKEKEAVERAVAEGWFPADQGDRLLDLFDIEDRIASLPGTGTDDAHLIPEIMAAWYRQQAETYLFRPPPQRRLGEAVVPTTHEDWEAGDPLRDIDWLETFRLRGELYGTGSPLKRSQIAEHEGQETVVWQPRLEIYLDVSGSMPDPRRAMNSMTLAAQILTMGTIRAGGWIRALIYSNDPVLYWEWCRSEVDISQFLMHYVGGGTQFPFLVLSKSVAECQNDQPIRVVISDTDFDRNYDANARAPAMFAQAVDNSPHFILLQHRPDDQRVKLYRSLGATVVEVEQMQDFPRMAADLTFALFPTGDHGTVPT